MSEASGFMLFVLASLALLVVPGPAVVYIVARSIDQGRWAGIVSALGLAVGSVVLVIAATFGVSAILATSPRAFDVLRYGGGAYLALLGIRTLAAKDRRFDDAAPEAVRLRRVFAEGIVVNLLNPKTALFFFAFLPQFVNPAGRVRLQIALFGLTFSLMGVVTDSVYATVAGAVAGRLRNDRGFPRLRRIVTGSVYVGLGILAVLVHPTKQ